MTTATRIKENILGRLAYSFRGLFHYCLAEEHGSIQEGLLLELEMKTRALNLHPHQQKEAVYTLARYEHI